MCHRVMREVLGSSAVAWQETTYYILPDESGNPTRLRLEPPVRVVSALGTGYAFRTANLRAIIVERLTGITARARGRQYEILDVSVFVDAGGGGGTLGNTIDKVTVFPRRVRVE
jgi:hypothetical protein